MAFKALEDAIQSLTKRFSVTERNTVKSMEWGAKAGPTSQVAQHINAWSKGVDSGGSIDAHSFPNWILLKEAGTYEITARQRVTGTASSYSSLALNGDRAALDSTPDGIFDHDHASVADHFSSSRFIGPLPAGSRITYGPTTGQASTMQYTTATFSGTIVVRRIS